MQLAIGLGYPADSLKYDSEAMIEPARGTRIGVFLWTLLPYILLCSDSLLASVVARSRTEHDVSRTTSRIVLRLLVPTSTEATSKANDNSLLNFPSGITRRRNVAWVWPLAAASRRSVTDSSAGARHIVDDTRRLTPHSWPVGSNPLSIVTN